MLDSCIVVETPAIINNKAVELPLKKVAAVASSSVRRYAAKPHHSSSHPMDI
jgi:hypothetical protein